MLKSKEAKTIYEIIASCTVKASLDLNASLIISFTAKGYIPFQLAKYRPRPLVIAITKSQETATYCELGYSLKSILIEEGADVDHNEVIKR